MNYSTLSTPSACALSNAGNVYCWGEAGTTSSGLLGDGSTTSTFGNGAVQVPGLSNVTAISSGSQVCALTGGAVECWGGDVPNPAPQWGYPGSTVPVAVTGLPQGIQGLAQGLPGEWAHQCAWTTYGVWCWGENGNGQLGNGTTTTSVSAVRVANLPSGVREAGSRSATGTAMARRARASAAMTTAGGMMLGERVVDVELSRPCRSLACRRTLPRPRGAEPAVFVRLPWPRFGSRPSKHEDTVDRMREKSGMIFRESDDEAADCRAFPPSSYTPPYPKAACFWFVTTYPRGSRRKS